MNNQKCIILVPVSFRIEPEVDAALRILEARGYEVWRCFGNSAIDQGRCKMAYHALFERDFDELFWIDSDVGFNPDDIEKIRGHNLPICAAVYPIKGLKLMTAQFLEGKEVTFGEGGGLEEIRYAATGFLHTRRAVYGAIKEHYKMPLCNAAFSQPIFPFFLPMLIETKEGAFYLGEDYSFCHRARECGFKIFADTSIKLHHIGSYAYSWDNLIGEISKNNSISFKQDGLRPTNSSGNNQLIFKNPTNSSNAGLAPTSFFITHYSHK